MLAGVVVDCGVVVFLAGYGTVGLSLAMGGDEDLRLRPSDLLFELTSSSLITFTLLAEGDGDGDDGVFVIAATLPLPALTQVAVGGCGVCGGGVATGLDSFELDLWPPAAVGGS